MLVTDVGKRLKKGRFRNAADGFNVSIFCWWEMIKCCCHRFPSFQQKSANDHFLTHSWSRMHRKYELLDTKPTRGLLIIPDYFDNTTVVNKTSQPPFKTFLLFVFFPLILASDLGKLSSNFERCIIWKYRCLSFDENMNLCHLQIKIEICKI